MLPIWLLSSSKPHSTLFSAPLDPSDSPTLLLQYQANLGIPRCIWLHPSKETNLGLLLDFVLWQKPIPLRLNALGKWRNHSSSFCLVWRSLIFHSNLILITLSLFGTPRNFRQISNHTHFKRIISISFFLEL